MSAFITIKNSCALSTRWRVVLLFVLPSVCSTTQWEWCRTGWECHPGCNIRSCLQWPLHTENTQSSSLITSSSKNVKMSWWFNFQCCKHLKKLKDFTDPHWCRWDRSSWRQQHSQHLTERATDGIEGLFCCSLVGCRRDLLKNRLKWAPWEAVIRKSGLSVRFFFFFFEAVKPHACHTTILPAQKFL